MNPLDSCRPCSIIHSNQPLYQLGPLNRKLQQGQGRANALYVLFYYIGGWLGITLAGFVYKQSGWSALVHATMLLLLIPPGAGLAERRPNRQRR